MTSHNDINEITFVQIASGDSAGLDQTQRKLLDAMNGLTRTGELAASLGLGPDQLKAALAGLLKRKLVRPVASAAPTVRTASAVSAPRQHQSGRMGPSFLPVLTEQLSLAIGPVAEFLIEDTLAELGLDPDRLPAAQAPELVEALAGEIPRMDRRVEFQKTMLDLLSQTRPD